jgi:ABC-2 type transport system permease protein
VQSLGQLKSEMRKGRAYAALYIPPNFTRELMAGHSAQVELLVDGSNSTTALQALHTGLGVALTQSLESLMRDAGRTGMPIDVRPQMLYNPAMRAPNDTPDKLDYDRFTLVVSGMEKVIQGLDKL